MKIALRRADHENVDPGELRRELEEDTFFTRHDVRLAHRILQRTAPGDESEYRRGDTVSYSYDQDDEEVPKAGVVVDAYRGELWECGNAGWKLCHETALYHVIWLHQDDTIETDDDLTAFDNWVSGDRARLRKCEKARTQVWQKAQEAGIMGASPNPEAP